MYKNKRRKGKKKSANSKLNSVINNFTNPKHIEYNVANYCFKVILCLEI